MSLSRRVAAEALGTSLLVSAVVGSGIMAERLAGGNVGIALLANTIATAATLVALIVALSPFSGAQFNPAVSLAEAIRGALPWRDVPTYWTAQFLGGALGTGIAQLMFGLPVLAISSRIRAGGAQLFSEMVATFGLVTVIQLCAHRPVETVASVVGLYIAGAYWFTASTSFANPAVTLARTLSDTFAGIRPQDAPGFIAAQFAGVLVSTALCRWLLAPRSAHAIERSR